MTPGSMSRFARSLTAIALGCVTLATGCYDGAELISRLRAQAIRSRLEEVEIGTFHLTLPRNNNNGETIELELTVFGSSERFKISGIETEVEQNAVLIEDKAIRTLRAADLSELSEPDFATLRRRLLAVTNESLTDAPLKSIGFKDVRIVRH